MIRISGDDIAFVAKKSDDFKIIVDNLVPQNKELPKLLQYSFHLNRVFFGYLMMWTIVELLVRNGFQSTESHAPIGPLEFLMDIILKNRIGDFIVKILSFYGLGLLPSMFYESKMKKLIDKTWPNIEFDFGPKQYRTAHNNKEVISYIFNTWIVAIIFFVVQQFIN